MFLFKTGIADEYLRHGTLSLFACINLVSGKISHKVLARNRSREFIEFLSLIESTNPVNEITMTLDNYKTHTSKATGSYLDTIKKKFKFVFTPIHASWLNAIENLFSRITRNLLGTIRVESIDGRVRELLINSEKASASPIFEENVERFSCIRFSITHGHDLAENESKRTQCYYLDKNVV